MIILDHPLQIRVLRKNMDEQQPIEIHLGISSQHIVDGVERHTVLVDIDYTHRQSYIIEAVEKLDIDSKALFIQSGLHKYHLIHLKLYSPAKAFQILRKYLDLGIEDKGHYFHSIRKGYMVLRLTPKHFKPEPLYIIGEGEIDWSIYNEYIMALETASKIVGTLRQNTLYISKTVNTNINTINGGRE